MAAVIGTVGALCRHPGKCGKEPRVQREVWVVVINQLWELGDLGDLVSSSAVQWVRARDATQYPVVPRMAPRKSNVASNIGGAQGEPGGNVATRNGFWDSVSLSSSWGTSAGAPRATALPI